MQKRQYAVNLHFEYKNRVETQMAYYQKLQKYTPGFHYPVLIDKIEKNGALAVLWGQIASKLDPGGTDYIELWRTGK